MTLTEQAKAISLETKKIREAYQEHNAYMRRSQAECREILAKCRAISVRISARPTAAQLEAQYNKRMGR